MIKKYFIYFDDDDDVLSLLSAYTLLCTIFNVRHKIKDVLI